MTILATYDDTEMLGRVRLTFSGYSTNADYATVERSTDQINWTLVRGGDKAALSGGAGHLDDYEFQANVQNYYRVTAIDSAPQSWVGSGGPVSGNNASVTPASNGSTLIGDLVLLLATIRNSGAGTPVQPAGWTTILDMGNVKLFGRYATTNGSVGQTVTFTGGVANADTTAQMSTFRNTGIEPSGLPATQTNASQQNLPWPSASPGVSSSMLVGLGWKQAGWTSAPTTGAWTSELGQISATAGDDAGHVWWMQPRTDASQKAAGFWTVTGGSAAVSKSALLFFPPRPYTDQEVTSVTPVVTRYRLKNPSRPGLNTFIEITDMSEITRRSRTGKFDVLGRTMPVAVTDVASSREFTFEIYVEGNSVADDMDNRLAGGEPLFLQGPGGEDDDVPTLYFVAGDVMRTRLAFGSKSITFTIPATEVAKPGATVYGDTFIWNDVVNTYADWNAVLADVTTWSNLVDKITQQDVIVN